jgi:aspartate-semialdehyde dehydrogenase
LANIRLTRKSGNSNVLAVVGGDSLLGKELRELIDNKHLPAQVKLIAAAAETVGILTAQQGEPAVMTALQADDIKAARIALLAGPAEASRKAYELAGGGATTIFVDASGALEDNPLARLRAPMVEPERGGAGKLQVIAHPAAIALAVFLRRLRQQAAIRRCIAVIFEPASERGQAGLDELQQQTVGLLSFQKLKKAVYDAQVSFNMLPQYGEDAPRSLEEIELTIDRHLASLLSQLDGVPMPSLRVVQAPVFHGYSFEIWVEFEQSPDLGAIAKGLAGDPIDVRPRDLEPPTNAGIAGQSGISVGAITADRNEARACWFWVVADNLRITGDNAVEVVRELLE